MYIWEQSSAAGKGRDANSVCRAEQDTLAIQMEERHYTYSMNQWK